MSLCSQPYGRRLIHQVLNDGAQQNPDRCIAYRPLTQGPSQGFERITVWMLDNAVNMMCWLIEEHLPNSKVMAYCTAEPDLRYWILEMAALRCRKGLVVPGPHLVDINCSIYSHQRRVTASSSMPRVRGRYCNRTRRLSFQQKRSSCHAIRSCHIPKMTLSNKSRMKSLWDDHPPVDAPA